MTGLFGTQAMPPDMQVEPPMQLLLLEHEGAGPGVVGGQCGHHAAAAGPDDHEVDGGVPRGHVTLPDLPTARCAPMEQASRIR